MSRRRSKNQTFAHEARVEAANKFTDTVPARAPDDVPCVAPDEDEDDQWGYYAVRLIAEEALVPTGNDADFIDEYEGRILYYHQTTTRQRVGRFRASVVRLDDALEAGIPSFELFDGHSQEFAEIWAALFDPKTEDLKDAIRNEFDVFSSSILVLERIEVLPAHRGRSVGLAVASKLIDMLGGMGGLVVCVPSPLQFVEKPASKDSFRSQMRFEDFPTDRSSVFRRLRHYWSTLGFKQVGSSTAAGIPRHF
jgi:hypothetical protein